MVMKTGPSLQSRQQTVRTDELFTGTASDELMTTQRTSDSAEFAAGFPPSATPVSGTTWPEAG